MIPGLPIFYKLDKKEAKRYKMLPGFVYMRPFTICFLNTIKEKYDIAVYSTYHPDFLAKILGTLQQEKEIFVWCITNSSKEGPKRLKKFMNQGRSEKNSLIVDQDPQVVAFNVGSCVPVTKFQGVCKDSTLLFLEKYLLGLADWPNISSQIQIDFSLPKLLKKD